MKKSILYVDDDLQSRLLVKHLLQKDYEVTLCANSKEAMDQLSRHHFDLILLDIRLEGDISGVELLNNLRLLPAYEDTPVIALTAFAYEQDKRFLMASGFTDYVSKPLHLKQFKEMIRNYMENETVTG
jgi:CheY-like chemotaxis protein